MEPNIKTPVEIIQEALTKEMIDEDGYRVELKLLPPLSEAQIAEFESGLPHPIPTDVRELLGYCRGIEGPVEVVDFTGRDCDFELKSVFPYGLPIAADGYGNFWVIDLLPHSTEWGPIYFACHDAPVILYQSPTLSHFLIELFKMNEPPHTSLVDDVHEDRLFQVWRKNPGVISYEECIQSQDANLREFAKELDPSFQVIDLRNAPIGFGFSWGRYGLNTEVRRYGYLPIFAYRKQKGILKRLFRL